MRGVGPLLDRVRANPLLVFLPLQAALLFWQLDLLPAWPDETTTLTVALQPAGDIPALLLRDIHPPLYYLLAHWWLALPLPGSALARARALSALWLIAATLVIWALWARNEEAGVPRSRRWWFATLWALSPSLLLYSRMARSYSMQLCLAAVALYAGLQLLRKPGALHRQLLFVLALTALLYTHYAPGGAVFAGVAGVLLWRALRGREWRLLGPLALISAASVLAYLPWLVMLETALSRWSVGHGYALTGNAALEHVLRLGYLFVSFTWGEVLGVPAFVLAVALSPLVLWVFWEGLRTRPAWLAVAVVTAAVGYIGVTRWVSFPFTPARLLFLYPLCLLLLVRGAWRSPRAGALACAAMLGVAVLGLPDYFRRQNFLNQGYTAPVDEIAALINHCGAPGELVVLDGNNSDAYAIAPRLTPKARIVVVLRHAGQAAQVRETEAPLVWYVRNTHDVSRRGLNVRLENELAGRYRVRRRLFGPYPAVHRLLMRAAGWVNPPTHSYQVLEMRAPR